MRNTTESAITSEIEEQLLRSYLTETPRPSERSLAKRFGVSASSVHRLLAHHKSTLTHALAQTNQPNQNEVTAALVVAAIPEATERVVAMTRDLTVTKMAKVLSECEAQYNSLKDTDPQIAGGYLAQMRQTLVEMAKWLSIENLNIDVQADRARDSRCEGCPREEWSDRAIRENKFKEAEAYFESNDPPCCKECPLRFPEKYPDTGPDRLKAYFQLLEQEKEIPQFHDDRGSIA